MDPPKLTPPPVSGYLVRQGIDYSQIRDRINTQGFDKRTPAKLFNLKRLRK